MGEKKWGSFLCSRILSGSFSFNCSVQWSRKKKQAKKALSVHIWIQRPTSFRVNHYISSQGSWESRGWRISPPTSLPSQVNLRRGLRAVSGSCKECTVCAESIPSHRPLCRKGMSTFSLWQITSKDGCQQFLPSLYVHAPWRCGISFPSLESGLGL